MKTVQIGKELAVSDVADPMETVESVVDYAIHNLCESVGDLDELRRHVDARDALMHAMSRADIELCRDRLSRILDDIGGHHG